MESSRKAAHVIGPFPGWEKSDDKLMKRKLVRETAPVHCSHTKKLFENHIETKANLHSALDISLDIFFFQF